MVSSPCKTSHTSGLLPPGLQKPGPPLKTKHTWLIGRKGGAGLPTSGFSSSVKRGDGSTSGQAVSGGIRDSTGPRDPARRLAPRRGPALPGGSPRPTPASQASAERCGAENAGCGGGPSRARLVRAAQSCVARTRSPVLIPRLLRSWTVSWVRPGHSPALSTPMFPGVRVTPGSGLVVPRASAGRFPFARRHPFQRGHRWQRGGAAARGVHAP